ncbi:hypothetical protein ABVT39_026938, partial [Epinephelus coioides]
TVTTGYGDLNNLHTAMTKHERASSHILCLVKLQTFGNTRIDHQLNNGLRVATELLEPRSRHSEGTQKGKDQTIAVTTLNYTFRTN